MPPSAPRYLVTGMGWQMGRTLDAHTHGASGAPKKSRERNFLSYHMVRAAQASPQILLVLVRCVARQLGAIQPGIWRHPRSRPCLELWTRSQSVFLRP